LESIGQAVPSLVRITGLVDTGASCTCIDPSVLQSLSLNPTGVATVNTPSTGTTPATADQYDVSIVIPGAIPTHAPFIVQNIPVLASVLMPQGFQALIGRDVLSECLLTYNGIMEQFTLAY
jgi:predicted aspartyl protease